MKFFIIEEKKLIILWSAKCACTSLKMILNKYYNYDLEKIHNGELDKNYEIFRYNRHKQPLNINEYPEIVDKFKTYRICFIYRNPYDRLVSGFMNKYVGGKYKTITEWNTFEDFVTILYNNPQDIDYHHFTKQTSEIGWDFFEKANKPKIDIFYQVNEVDNVCKLLDMPIFDARQSFKDHYFPFLNNKVLYNKNTPLYNMHHKELQKIKRNYKFNNYKLFYNDNIIKMVDSIYKDDFKFLNDNNILTKY